MSIDGLTEKGETLLKQELDQAWNHYRHLEDIRTKYLNFFFTIFLASIGFVLTLFKDVASSVSLDLVWGISIFFLILYFISQIIFASIVRIGYVLAVYDNVMKNTRIHFHGLGSQALEIWDIRSQIPQAVNRGIFSIQKSSQILVITLSSTLIIAELYISYYLSSQLNKWLAFYPLTALCFSIVMLVSLGIFLGTLHYASKQLNYRLQTDAGCRPRC